MFSKFLSSYSNKSTTNDDKNESSISSLQREVDEGLERAQNQLESMPVNLVALVAFALGGASSLGGALLYARYGRRIRNTDWITPNLFTRKRWIRGIVTNVGDADNFRLFHTPSFGGWRWPFKFRRIPTSTKELKDQTLHVRIAGVDAPEAAHFGKPAQPHSNESLAWLRQKISGKPIYCQLLRRDQYHRVVAHVCLAPRFLPGVIFRGKNLSLEMLAAGCVMTYEQAGAEYGPEGKTEYLRVENEARAAKRGMWAGGKANETPAEYKRRHSGSSVVTPPALSRRRTKSRERTGGWLSSLFRRK
ncbi:hypothetical protein AGABI1DRAFT_80027 [Agaricus bisporus var. burnettii JB137-S8]|uniref:TNase-like domain-containing protein n=1 Tax=Agaricus bisporus var. burnettii (strain JB137-S8 / ATCC MYA-4627 / FGSC 10392) TaxID=597362 RepID=K5XLK0_AGABU|nr:uncharacterized protein AGABI1DRAFT_80027 [Agaricus bisporus var. burnettii JB137-S8]EKM75415.1 hypothetical protein AGABI1DRAFT_80027 [Agaricus bisporus var. burnettii JB137-S8]